MKICCLKIFYKMFLWVIGWYVCSHVDLKFTTVVGKADSPLESLWWTSNQRHGHMKLFPQTTLRMWEDFCNISVPRCDFSGSKHENFHAQWIQPCVGPPPPLCSGNRSCSLWSVCQDCRLSAGSGGPLPATVLLLETPQINSAATVWPKVGNEGLLRVANRQKLPI